MVRQVVGMVILVYASLTEYFNHRNGWVVCHISEPRKTSNIFAGLTRKEPSKPRLMTMEEIDSVYDPNEDKWPIEGGCGHTVNSVNLIMQSYRNRIITKN